MTTVDDKGLTARNDVQRCLPDLNFLTGIFFKLARRRRRSSCSSPTWQGRKITMADICQQMTHNPVMTQ